MKSTTFGGPSAGNRNVTDELERLGGARRELADWIEDRGELLALGHREGSEAVQHCDEGIAAARALVAQLEAEAG